MAAPIGNKFWEQRSSHGRKRIFSSPKVLWEAACEYFEWCEENPLPSVEFNGKDAIKCEVPKMRAFTLQGLCLFLDVNTKYFNEFEKELEGKEDKMSKGFSEIVTRIREIIFNQKYTGAAAGMLNPNIIARDLGLVDKKDMTTDGQRLPSNSGLDLSKLPLETLMEIAKYTDNTETEN
ncbi:DNA-packaging protein [Danxiaibacter flavus]|uniref:DNA-packaging protein n=1 Tax=Danxiaibacter flavus TaxID=3049108 RepID=A0ABV3ZNX2_9BACT|nr:DNA-packaging protein [Chitinophagaceae bacterium DXS]